MTVTLNMPRLGETMEEGTVTDWLIEEGARFKRGDALVEFETDKTAVEYPALGSGILASALVAAGDVVKVGDPIAEIDLDGADDWVSPERETVPEPTGQDDTVITELQMPRLGETMEEGTIVSWMKMEGEGFERGVPILEVETDKTVAEFPALFRGKLIEILAQPGETIAVGRVIARIEVAREDAPDVLADDNKADQGDIKDVPTAVSVQRSTSGAALRATPPARRAAQKGGVDLQKVTGTGRRGRIELRDIESAHQDTPHRSQEGLAETLYGPSDGSRVLMIHGFAGDRLTLDQLGQGLGKAGLNIRSVDLPGHGETTEEASTFNDVVAAISSNLAGNDPVHVVAHSLGAAAAIKAVASGVPALSLTLIAPAGLGLRIDGSFVAGMANPASVGVTGHLLRRLSRRASTFSNAAIEQIYNTLAAGRLCELAEDIVDGDLQKIDLTRDLAQLAGQMRVRIIIGHRDAILDWQDMLKVSPQIAVHHLPEAGHMPHWDAPDAIRDLLIKELQNV